MINHRLATEEACWRLFDARDPVKFKTHLEGFSNQLKDMAEQAQYTMIAHALDAFDKAFRVAKNLDNNRVTEVARLLPLSLKACLVALEHVDAEGAHALAMNIVKHETFPEESDLYINEVMQNFCNKGFASLTPLILDKLFRIPFGDEDFDYMGFVDTLYEAFNKDCQYTIDWAVGFEDKLMESGFSEKISVYTKQYMGNMFYKKGLKSLGAKIMEIDDKGSRGLELHDRDRLLGLRIKASENNGYDREALALYLLGSDFIEPEWYSASIEGLTSKIVDMSAHVMRITDVGLAQANLEQVLAIAVANCTKASDIKSFIAVMDTQKIALPENLANYAINSSLRYFTRTPQDVVDIMKLEAPLGATLDFTPHIDKISKAVNTWATTHQLTVGDILSCHFGSRDGFPCDIVSVATAVDCNWKFWNDKDRRVALEQLPYEVVTRSKHLKGLKLSDELGL